jgi:hypothetical protein
VCAIIEIVKGKHVSRKKEIKSPTPNCTEGLRILAHIVAKAYLADSEAKTKDRKIPDGEK